MNKKSKSSRDAMDCIEFNNDATRFDRDLQYLKKANNISLWKQIIINQVFQIKQYHKTTTDQLIMYHIITMDGDFLFTSDFG